MRAVEYYENIARVSRPLHDDLLRGFDIVKRYIISKNLILTGGTAIDYALRLTGDSLYSDDILPDYDAYSPNHMEDAYALGTLLCQQGFPNVSVINGVHLTTMKVRIDFVDVADITYCPPAIFRTVPTLNYNNLRVVHPHWQMADQHSALVQPFENPGREVIFHRWKKDMDRYDKLYAHYPIVDEIEYIKERQFTDETGASLLNMVDIILPLKLFANSCIEGWGAIDYTIKGNSINLSIPRNENIMVSSHNFEQFIRDGDLKVVSYRAEYFGKLPRRVICTGFGGHTIEILDTYGQLRSATKIADDVWMCNIQAAMLYLLVRIFSSRDKRVLHHAKTQYNRCRDLVMAGSVPSIDMYGTDVFTLSLLNRRMLTKEQIYSIKAPKRQPKHAYPTLPSCEISNTFDLESSPYFITDGREISLFTRHEIDPYPDFNSKKVKAV